MNAKAVGAKRVLPLPVSVPSHSDLMLPAAEMLADRLNEVDVSTTDLPVYHNVDCSIASSADSIKAKLVKQLHAPVHWVGSVQAIKATGVNTFVESGPGKVLGGLIKRIDREAVSFSVETPEMMQKCAQALT